MSRPVQTINEPFRHYVIDDAVPAPFLRAVDALWPSATDPNWHVYGSGKRASRFGVPDGVRPILELIASHPVVLHNYPNAWPDWTLTGAGLHEMPPGAELGPHLDADHVPTHGAHRLLSAVLFANPRPVSGGALQLHDRDGRIDGVIRPEFNRLVIFECSDISKHSVATVAGAEPRRSIALFFCDNESGERKRSNALFDSSPESAFRGRSG